MSQHPSPHNTCISLEHTPHANCRKRCVLVNHFVSSGFREAGREPSRLHRHVRLDSCKSNQTKPNPPAREPGLALALQSELNVFLARTDKAPTLELIPRVSSVARTSHHQAKGDEARDDNRDIRDVMKRFSTQTLHSIRQPATDVSMRAISFPAPIGMPNPLFARPTSSMSIMACLRGQSRSANVLPVQSGESGAVCQDNGRERGREEM
jgi:hypothetical protein